MNLVKALRQFPLPLPRSRTLPRPLHPLGDPRGNLASEGSPLHQALLAPLTLPAPLAKSESVTRSGQKGPGYQKNLY